MRAKFFILGLGIAMTAVATGVLFWVKQQTALRLAAVESLRANEASARARLMGAEARVAAAEKAASDVTARQREGVQGMLADVDALLDDARVRVREKQDNDPQFQALWAAAEADEYVRLYRPFFRRRGLSAEQIERLKAEYLRGRLMRLDLAAIRRAGGLSARDEAIGALEKEAAEARRVAELAVLGEAGVERMREWERTVSVRSAVMSFAGKAMLMGVPIDTDQAERLVGVLATSGPKAQTGRYSFAAVNWQAASEAARGVLSAEQHSFFATQALKFSAMDEANREMDRARKMRATGTSGLR